MPPPVPEYIQFFPTLRCNRSCGFCFNRGLTTEVDIAADNFKRLACTLLDVGIREIDILGGEPTLHPEIVRLIDIVVTSGLRLNLSTNGTNVAMLEHLSRTYDKDAMNIGISLNDSRTGKELDDYITRYRPAVKSIFKKKTVSGHTSAYFDMPGITSYLLYMDTVSKQNLKDGAPFNDYYKQLSVLQNKHDNVEGVYCGGFIPDTEKHPFLRNARCPAGTTKLSVLPDGSVYPCYLFFRHSDFRLGNVLTDRFESILMNPILDYFREFRGNKCPDVACELFSDCHGGCPAISLLICNDIDAPDPRCIR
ncbi:MAG: SPASM domain-containing protein [Nitrospirae bacterium]|nr:SPASM domain-containing protein [Nitrospirota bacterium]